MKSRKDDIKQAVRLSTRKIRLAEIDGDLATILLERLQVIKSTVEFVVRDVTAEELSEAIVETFDEIDSECKALKPIAQFCLERLAKRNTDDVC